MRPHIMGLPHPSIGERTLQRYLKRVEVRIAVVSLLVELAKVGQWTCARQWIYAIDPSGGEQPMPLATLVSNLAQKAVPEQPLDR